MSVTTAGEERLAVVVHRRWADHAVVQKWRDQDGHVVKVAAELGVDMQLPRHGLAVVVVNFATEHNLQPFHFRQTSLSVLERFSPSPSLSLSCLHLL